MHFGAAWGHVIGTMNIHINAQFVCTTQDVKKRYKTVLGWGGLGGGPMRYEEELAVLHEAAWKLLFHSVFWAGRSWWNSQCALLRRECSILQEMEPLTVHVGKTLGHYSMRPGVSVGKQSALCHFNC